MNSPSKQTQPHQSDQAAEKMAREALDNSVEHLSQRTLDDIALLRQRALNQNKTIATPKSVTNRVSQWFTAPFAVAATSMAVAVLIVLNINYQRVDSIPPLPALAFSAEVPSEELSLLEDLDFLIWLAQHEQQSQI